MQDENVEKARLLELLREEIARLLCSDDVTEEEKLSRIMLAQQIIENGEA